MATVEEEINEILFGRLAVIAQSLSLPIAPLDKPFTPPSGPYLRARTIRNTNRNQFVSDTSSTEFRGIFQIDVIGLTSTGVKAADALAGQIAKSFDRSTSLVGATLRLKSDKRPDVATAMIEVDRIRVPVSVFWHAFA